MIPYIFILGKPIHMYGLCVVVGIFASSFFLLYRCKKESICPENAIVIGALGIGLGFIMAKLLYIFVTFRPKELLNLIESKSLSPLLNGGFVFYGGLIGGILGGFIGAEIAKTNIKLYENSLVISIPLAHFFGRIGCLCAGCCYGRPTDTHFGIIYKNPIGNTPLGIPLIPVQIYEAVYNLIIFLFLFILDKKTRNKRLLLPCYLLLYSMGRFVLEFLRYDYIRGIYFGLSTSQIISIFIGIIGIILLLVRSGILFKETLD